MGLNNQYIIAVGESEGSHLKSYIVSRRRLILYSLGAIIVLLLLAILLAHTILQLELGYQSQDLKRENNRLRQRFGVWEQRLAEMESSMEDIKKRNRQIRITASMETPEMEYGVGGSENPQRAGLLEIPDVVNLEYNISRVEAEMNWLHMSTSEIERMLSTKIQEIAHYPSIRPVRGGWITSHFGKRPDPFTGVEEDHPGLDISVRPESEVRATGAGRVKRINTRVIKNKGYGKYIQIDHGYGYETLYAHLSEIFVKPGQRVKRWDLIGLSGNTGKSTAPHIHYGVYYKSKAVNPLDFLLE